MAKYRVHEAGVARAHERIEARQYVLAYGDLRRVHRSALIACVYRASEWHHKSVELAAHDLLQHLDEVAGIGDHE